MLTSDVIVTSLANILSSVVLGSLVGAFGTAVINAVRHQWLAGLVAFAILACLNVVFNLLLYQVVYPFVHRVLEPNDPQLRGEGEPLLGARSDGGTVD